jgi:hypothetical protein
MFTVSTRLSQWTAHKVSSSAATALEASSAYHMAPLHPAWIAAARRFQHSTVSVAVHQQAPPLQRWKQNLSRIYARRIIEIAIASAATQRLLTDMEKVHHCPLRCSTSQSTFRRRLAMLCNVAAGSSKSDVSFDDASTKRYLPSRDLEIPIQ